MQNAGLDKAQAGIKIAGRNINNLRYADDTTFMAESKEKLKSLLMKVKGQSEKVDLKFNIQKMKITALVPSFHGKQMGNNGNCERLNFFGLQITAGSDCSHETKRRLLLGKKLWPT